MTWNFVSPGPKTGLVVTCNLLRPAMPHHHAAKEDALVSSREGCLVLGHRRFWICTSPSRVVEFAGLLGTTFPSCVKCGPPCFMLFSFLFVESVSFYLSDFDMEFQKCTCPQIGIDRVFSGSCGQAVLILIRFDKMKCLGHHPAPSGYSLPR